MNVPVFWRSHEQKSVTLSTTEAEYVACSEVVKEVFYPATFKTSTSRITIADSCTCR